MGRRSRQRIRSGLQPPKQPRVHLQSDGRGHTDGMLRRVEEQFSSALEKFDVGQGSLARGELVALAGWWTEGVGRLSGVTPGLVPALVCSYLSGEIDEAWERGWQPADVHRLVRRRMSSHHLHLAVDAIAEESEAYRSRQRVLPAWLDQLDEMDAVLRWGPAADHLAHFAEERNLSREALLRTAFELIVMLHRLPAIPLLVPPPSQWDRSAALDAALASAARGWPDGGPSPRAGPCAARQS